jgi:hypothetical protein
VLLIDKNDWDSLNDQLKKLEAMIEQLAFNKPVATMTTGWVPLPIFLRMFGIPVSSWYALYKDKIKHSKDGGKVWVYAPSMEKFLADKAIN